MGHDGAGPLFDYRSAGIVRQMREGKRVPASAMSGWEQTQGFKNAPRTLQED
jgi:hypothetical protein